MNSKLGYYIRKAKTLPPEKVIKKGFCRIKNKGVDIICKIFANVLGTTMTDAEFLKKVWNSSYQFDNFKELRKYFCERKESRFFIDPSKREDIVLFIYEHFPHIPDKVITEADKICEHVFDLLGSGPVKVYHRMKAKGFEGYRYNSEIESKELAAIHYLPSTMHNYKLIDWHIDFKSGYRWSPKTYYKDTEYGHRLGADVKVPWQLSRFITSNYLAEAYFLSNDEKYV